MEQTVTIDVLGRDTIRMTVRKGRDVVAVRDIPSGGSVDNKLLTIVDNLYSEHILDKFAQIQVGAGPGVDNYSLLDRITLTLDAALRRTGRGGRKA